MEAELMSKFTQRSVPYLSKTVDDPWEWLFLMQHYGVPTRLLDWTENPYIALYFALVPPHEPPTDAVVWVLDHVAWNRTALHHVSFTGEYLSTRDSILTGYTPGTDVSLALPVAITGPHNSPRMVAQRGVFVVFGKNPQPMETIYEESQFPAGSLAKIELPAAALADLRDSVHGIGLTESAVFPDLEGLARELKRETGFRG